MIKQISKTLLKQSICPPNIKFPIVLMINDDGDMEICEWVKFYTNIGKDARLDLIHPIITLEYQNLLYLGYRPIEYLKL